MTRLSISTNMAKENVSLDFSMKKINETRNYVLDEIKHYDLMSEKHKKVWRTLNYIEHFFILLILSYWCVSSSAFASLVIVAIVIASSAIGLKILAITTVIKD